MVQTARCGERLRGRTVNVFIVDDSAAIRDALVSMLTGLKQIRVVGSTGDATTAPDRIREMRPDVAILDIRMPGMSGIEILRRLKREPYPPVVIILTNYPYPQYRERCQKAGADYFLDKSTEFDRLVRTLRGLAEQAGD